MSLRTDRGLLKLILLTVITFGIYGLYFTYKFAADMNVACNGDGKHTRGLLAQILLNIITLGIYSFFWMYGVGERINTACVRAGIPSRCTGGSLLLWEIFGSLIVVGPFVAMHKMIHGLNDVCALYNSRGRA